MRLSCAIRARWSSFRITDRNVVDGLRGQQGQARVERGWSRKYWEEKKGATKVQITPVSISRAPESVSINELKLSTVNPPQNPESNPRLRETRKCENAEERGEAGKMYDDEMTMFNGCIFGIGSSGSHSSCSTFPLFHFSLPFPTFAFTSSFNLIPGSSCPNAHA